MASVLPPATPFRGWLQRIAATVATALVATPLAGAIGGAVLFVAVRLSQPDASALLLLAFVFYGALLGGLLAWPVTMLALPACTLVLHARRSWARRLSPVAGLITGTWCAAHESPGLFDMAPGQALLDPGRAMVLAGAIGGLCAGLLFAWLPPLLAPRAFAQ